jgi:peroxiredoxin
MTDQQASSGHPVMRRRLWVAALALALVTGAGFLLASRPAAPATDFITLEGERLSTASLRGQVVLVNFWATSCTTCMKEMPEIVETHHRFAGRPFTLLAVAMSYDPPNYVRNYAQQHRLPFKVVLDGDGSIAAAFDNVNLTPTAVLIDRKGRVLRRILGGPDFVQLRALIEQELAS